MSNRSSALRTLLDAPRRARADAALRLVKSLEDAGDANAERAWTDEIRSRIADIEAGRVALVPASVALRRARARLVSARTRRG